MRPARPKARSLASPAAARRRLRVLLADGSRSARRALAAIIADIDGVTLVGQVETREQMTDALRRLKVDLLVLDDRLHPHDGHPLAGSGPLAGRVRVIVLGMDGDAAFAARADRFGAEAWIAKDEADERLRELLAR